jgi:hypothetical protein
MVDLTGPNWNHIKAELIVMHGIVSQVRGVTAV